MINLIEVTGVELVQVSGACWCICLVKPFDRMRPSEMIGEFSSEELCANRCSALGWVYCSCN